MSRLIDADALQNDLMNLKKRHLSSEILWWDVINCASDIVSEQPTCECTSELNSKETRWIPCSERMPEKKAWYLVTSTDGYVKISWFDEEWKYGRVDTFTAWMPLPEPYKEGEE